MFNDISITGITPLDHYPNKCSTNNCKQNINSTKLCIPSKKPSIESINEIKVMLCVDEYKTLKTILGTKVLINITCNIKAIYTALNEEQSLHSAHWDINFYDFILSNDSSLDRLNTCKQNLFIGLEDICISNFDTRTIDLSLLYIICINLNYNNCCSTKRYDCEKEKQIFTLNSTPIKDSDEDTYYYPVEYYGDPHNI